MKKYSSYEKYKLSNIDWLGEIPEHWNDCGLTHRMESIVDYRGKTPEKVDSGIFLITAKNIKDGYIDYDASQEFVREEDYFEIMQRGLPCIGDILMTTEAPLGNIAQVDNTNVALAQRIIKFSARKDSFQNHFLYYQLRSSFFKSQLEKFATGSTALGIKAERFCYLKLLYPPLLEQQKIADFLDRETAKIDSLIKKRYDLIKLLQEKRSAVISHAVTKGIDPMVRLKPSNIDWLGEIPEHWDVKKLKFLGTALIGLTYSPDDVVDENYLGKKYLVLRSSNIQNNKIELSDTVFVTKEIPQELKVQKDDILICARNGSRLLVGKSARINSALPNTTFGAFMTVFRSKINSFLSFYFNSNQFQSQTTIFLTTTINQLTNHDLNEVWVSVPPLSEQQKIADFLDRETAKIDSLIEKEKQIIEKMKEYRTALISAAVTGKIDVRGEENA